MAEKVGFQVSVAEGVAIFLGVWGTVLSTILAVREFRRGVRRVRVIFDVEGAFDGGGPVSGVWGFSVRVVNIGYRPVEVRRLVVRLGGGGDLPLPVRRKGLPDPQDGTLFPLVKLEEGASTDVGVKAFDFVTGLQRLANERGSRVTPVAVVVECTAGRRYRGRLSRSQRESLTAYPVRAGNP